MSINHFNYGVSVAQRWLQTGWPGDLNAIGADANAKDAGRRNAGDLAMLGALITIARALSVAQKSGVRFSAALPSVDRVVYARSRGVEDYSSVATLLVNSAISLRKQQPGIKFSWPQPADSTKADAEQSPKPEPLEIKIVSMPDRETTSSVTRDGKDNITSTKQIERDAA